MKKEQGTPLCLGGPRTKVDRFKWVMGSHRDLGSLSLQRCYKYEHYTYMMLLVVFFKTQEKI